MNLFVNDYVSCCFRPVVWPVRNGASALKNDCYVKGKVKVRPRTGHEGPEGEKRYSSILTLTSALDGGWVVNATPRPLYPRERPGTYCIGGWVGPRSGLDGCGKSRPHQDSIPGPSSPWQVTIPTELSRPTMIVLYNIKSAKPVVQASNNRLVWSTFLLNFKEHSSNNVKRSVD